MQWFLKWFETDPGEEINIYEYDENIYKRPNHFPCFGWTTNSIGFIAEDFINNTKLFSLLKYSNDIDELKNMKTNTQNIIKIIDEKITKYFFFNIRIER